MSVPQVDPSQCTIEFGYTFGDCAIVQTVDTTGQLMTSGGAKVEATQDGWGSNTVEDKNDGTYTFNCSLFSGLLHVKINGTPMKGSPFDPFNY